jgi:hydroxypyruvate isomerase
MDPGKAAIARPDIRRLDRESYADRVGCEYKPAAATSAGLAPWFAPYRSRPA